MVHIGSLTYYATLEAQNKHMNLKRYAITHTDTIHVKGWSGAGYIAIDPNSGDGAYEISGGMNGAWLDPEDGLSIALVAMGILSLSLTGLASIAILAMSIFYSIILAWYTYDLLKGCVPLQKLSAGIATIAFLVGFWGKTFAWIITISGFGYLFVGNILAANNLCKD